MGRNETDEKRAVYSIMNILRAGTMYHSPFPGQTSWCVADQAMFVENE